MTQEQKPYRSMPIGVVVKRQPGVTRWAKYAWKATSILPGAGDAHWRELRREGDVVEFLSYEGTLTAANGPAAAMSSSDIGVSESSAVALGDSLQRQGQGGWVGSFGWGPPAPHSHGTVNAGQLLMAALPVPALSAWGRVAAGALLLGAAMLAGAALRPSGTA